jgi:hypothetical protein
MAQVADQVLSSPPDGCRFLGVRAACSAVAVYAMFFSVCFALTGSVAPEALERHMPDDAYYYLQIARNIAAGSGSCFSPGEITNGYHPLWLGVLAAIQWSVPSSPDAMALLAPALSALSTAASAVPFARFLTANGLAARDAEYCAAIYALNPWITCYAVSGMETGLLLLLLFTFATLASRAAAPPAVWFGVVAGLLMLARTDSIFFTGAAFLWLAIARRRSLPWLVKAGAVATATVAPWLLWCHANFGTVKQASSDAIALIIHEQIGSGILGHVRVGLESMSRLAMQILTYPLVRFPQFTTPGHVVAGLVLAGLGLVHLAHRRRWPTVPPRLPVWFWGSALALLIYFHFLRHAVQPWHMATIVVLCLTVAACHLARMPLGWRRAAIVVLAGASLWAAHNGFYAPQDGGIRVARLHDAEPGPRRILGHTDCGRFGYFNRHEVVNLDGIVNNAALHHIRSGRLDEYMVAQGFETVFMTPDRFGFYCRGARSERIREMPAPASIHGDVRGAVDLLASVLANGRLDGSADCRLQGWVLGPHYDAAATVPVVAFLDQEQVPLAAFRGVRLHRPDLAPVLREARSRYAGYELDVPRALVPTEARFLRLGVGSRDGMLWSPEVTPIEQFAAAPPSMRSMHVQPAALHVDDPRRKVRVLVLGRDADGSEQDLTLAPRTRFSLLDGELARITAAGELVALRRGRTELVVRHGSHEAVVAVTADWPDVIVAEDATAGPGPGLHLLAEPTGGARPNPAFRCEGLPEGTRGVFGIAAHPIAAVAPGLPQTGAVSWQALAAGDGRSATVDNIPVPAASLRDVPFYARVLLLAADSDRVVAASNTIILTFD